MSGYEGSVGTRASRACEFGGRVGSTTTANHRRISTDGSVGSIRMPERREPLCPQCGGVSYEQIDACHSRCSECGLGRTSQPLIAQAGAIRSPASAPRSHERVHMADIAGRIRGAFADASFAPYGLDDRWQGRGGSAGQGAAATRSPDSSLRMARILGTRPPPRFESRRDCLPTSCQTTPKICDRALLTHPPNS
jgi:ribosomal protein L37E